MIKSQNQVAKELGISKSYLSDILNGRKGCNSNLMERILTYYPDLKFYINNPRWKVKSKGINNMINESEFTDEYLLKLQGQLEEKTYLYNKLQTESKYVINKQKEVIDKIKEYLEEDDWTSVNGVIAVKLIKEKLNDLLEEIE